MQFNTNNKESGELVLYSTPECREGIFCYYKEKACIYKHEGQSAFIVNQNCQKGTYCNFINKLCNLKHSLDKRIRGYINPNLVCDRRTCKGFDVNNCNKLHMCDYDECMKHAFTFRNVECGVTDFMKNILPKINSDRILKRMGLPIMNLLAPSRGRSRSRERHMSKSPERRRSRSRERRRSRSHDRRRDRSNERRPSRYRSRSHERKRSRSRDRVVSNNYHQTQSYMRPPEPYARAPEPLSRRYEPYPRAPEPLPRAHQHFQRAPDPFLTSPIQVAVSSDPPKRVITIQPKQTDIRNLLNSAIKDGQNKIITNVNDFETKCRNVPNCHLHNFKACKFMHKDQIDECLALYEATKNIKLAQDLAKKMMDAAYDRFRNSGQKKSSNTRYFDMNQDYIPLPF